MRPSFLLVSVADDVLAADERRQTGRHPDRTRVGYRRQDPAIWVDNFEVLRRRHDSEDPLRSPQAARSTPFVGGIWSDTMHDHGALVRGSRFGGSTAGVLLEDRWLAALRAGGGCARPRRDSRTEKVANAA